MIVYLKVSGVGVAAGVADERQRLLRAAGKLAVPSVIDAGDDEGMAWMFDFRLPTAMTHVRTRLRCGQIDTTAFKVEYAHHTPETAVLALRRDLPAAEDLVLTHGDYCVPNIVFDGDHLSRLRGCGRTRRGRPLARPGRRHVEH